MIELENAINQLITDPFNPVLLNVLDKDYILDQLKVRSKYWNNTLIPLINSRHLSAIINNEYIYPHRVGLFAGLSCMFYCGFCGRNKSAAYERNTLDAGMELYKQLITDSPRDGADWQDRFRISGGQEPLTNPRVGELATHAKQLGYKVSMYTNGYMLTPKYSEKLADLKMLRISVYGYDDASYFQVTKKQNAWTTVSENLKQLELYNTTLGVNYIVLPGHSQDYLKLIHSLVKLQDSMKRPINFLTVREDFSQDLIYIDEDERQRLASIIQQVNTIANQYMPDLKIDYGYALDPLQYGKSIGPLRMAKYHQLDGYGLPQASVQVDILGNIYAYHETAFLDRPGSNKFIIGNVKEGVENVIKKHLSGKPFDYLPSDPEMLDAFDHAVSLAVWAAKQGHPLFL